MAYNDRTMPRRAPSFSLSVRQAKLDLARMGKLDVEAPDFDCPGAPACLRNVKGPDAGRLRYTMKPTKWLFVGGGRLSRKIKFGAIAVCVEATLRGLGSAPATLPPLTSLMTPLP